MPIRVQMGFKLLTLQPIAADRADNLQKQGPDQLLQRDQRLTRWRDYTMIVERRSVGSMLACKRIQIV